MPAFARELGSPHAFQPLPNSACLLHADPVLRRSDTRNSTIGPISPPALEVPAGARVFFKSPESGAELTSPIKLQFGVSGMDIRPAGTDEKGTGHHHVLIDRGAFPMGEVIHADETHIHFGKGQTEAEVALAPGTHRLTMQFADFAHRSYGDQMSSTIEITVIE